ncbi:MAG: hypothetical protein WCJ84_00435 [Candidatus Peregrinibacteria bacterium]
MKDLIDYIIALLETNLVPTRGIKKVYWGDPIMIAGAYMPCIAVDGDKTNTEVADSANDEDTYGMSISVILNAQNWMGQSDGAKNAKKELMAMMEERNTNGTRMSDTVLQIARTELLKKSNVLSVTGATVDYGFRERKDTITVEAICRFVVRCTPYLR